ncbi:MAG TPA: uroporphyrinogen decarboxylase family protein [Chthonomonadales bacterium]|nr:uroporphyrinogen decarboxylase family protein [Chthonomonadales bacterium]
MTSRERMNLALKHQEADRIPRTDSFWGETLHQWRQQGLEYGVDVGQLFDFDVVGAGWVHHDARPGFQRILEETEEWRIRMDGNGAILRYWRHKSGTPEHIGFTVNSPDTWRQLKAELLSVPIEVRVEAYPVLAAMHRARAEERWFCWAGVECFEVAKDVLGHEQLCIAMAEEPDWARDVFETETDIAVRALDFLERCGVKFDGAWIFGDIAYNHGPFCSPKMYRELVMPAHARHVGWFKDRGLPVIYHTDGDFRPLIPSFLEIGIDCFQPLEAKAGMDVRELKPKYGDCAAFMGNIDVMVLLTNDPEQIEAEVASKVPLAKKGGGYIYHSDHSVPPGVTWETYKFLMKLIDEYGSYCH